MAWGLEAWNNAGVKTFSSEGFDFGFTDDNYTATANTNYMQTTAYVDDEQGGFLIPLGNTSFVGANGGVTGARTYNTVGSCNADGTEYRIAQGPSSATRTHGGAANATTVLENNFTFTTNVLASVSIVGQKEPVDEDYGIQIRGDSELISETGDQFLSEVMDIPQSEITITDSNGNSFPLLTDDDASTGYTTDNFSNQTFTFDFEDPWLIHGWHITVVNGGTTNLRIWKVGSEQNHPGGFFWFAGVNGDNTHNLGTLPAQMISVAANRTQQLLLGQNAGTITRLQPFGRRVTQITTETMLPAPSNLDQDSAPVYIHQGVQTLTANSAPIGTNTRDLDPPPVNLTFPTENTYTTPPLIFVTDTGGVPVYIFGYERDGNGNYTGARIATFRSAVTSSGGVTDGQIVYSGNQTATVSYFLASNDPVGTPDNTWGMALFDPDGSRNWDTSRQVVPIRNETINRPNFIWNGIGFLADGSSRQVLESNEGIVLNGLHALTGTAVSEFRVSFNSQILHFQAEYPLARGVAVTGGVATVQCGPVTTYAFGVNSGGSVSHWGASYDFHIQHPEMALLFGKHTL